MTLKPVDAFVVDIETASPSFQELDQHTSDYLIDKLPKEQRTLEGEELEQAISRSMVDALGLSPIIAIGMWRTDKQAGVLLQESEEARPHEARDNYTVVFGREKLLLEQFWSRAATANRDGVRLITFCGERFDIPTIMIRSALLGVVPTCCVITSRYAKRHTFHLDLENILTFRGAARKMNLDYWCRRFGIESPKGSLSGPEVAPAYRAGRIDDIGRYCMGDVQATAELYTKLEATILPHCFD